MKRKVPEITTDEEAEAFLEQDLSDLDFTQFKPVKFKAKARGVPYTRFVREVLERATAEKPDRPRR
jgi:predicted DNA binding CopG/RHH family protein